MSKRIEVTVKFSYKADPGDYGTDDLVEMAEIDYRNFTDDVYFLGEVVADAVAAGDAVIRVECFD